MAAAHFWRDRIRLTAHSPCSASALRLVACAQVEGAVLAVWLGREGHKERKAWREGARGRRSDGERRVGWAAVE